MFEFDQGIVDALLREDKNFKRLHSKHGELKEQVNNANKGAAPLEDYALEALKKEKLQIKDQMAAIISQYRRDHPN